MGVLRSEKMKCGTLVLPREGARDFVNMIGSKVNVEFQENPDPLAAKPYKRYVHRLDETERITRYLTEV